MPLVRVSNGGLSDPNKIIEYLLRFDGLRYQRAANINYIWNIFSKGKVTKRYVADGSDGNWRVSQTNGIYTSAIGTYLVFAGPISGLNVGTDIFSSPTTGIYVVNKTTAGEQRIWQGSNGGVYVFKVE